MKKILSMVIMLAAVSMVACCGNNKKADECKDCKECKECTEQCEKKGECCKEQKACEQKACEQKAEAACPCCPAEQPAK